MKSRVFLPPPTARALRWWLVAGCAAVLTGAARAQLNDLDVGVRSAWKDKPFGKSDAKPGKDHGRVYALLQVKMIASEDKLVKPVDANRLAGLVVHELDAHGFSRVLKGNKPEILITILYGRGWLRNPYLACAGPETPGGESSVGGVDAPSVTITGIPSQLFKEKGTGFEGKLQKAQYEKLYIHLTAWKYPTEPKERAKQLWTTTMIVDDPDHRDLNAVAAEMLAAGAPYFDKEINEEEVDVNRPLPEGRVNLGTPEVVDPFKPREK